ncbi:hypothetical protein EJB05_07629 [Eragrostis curvula]|uniref:DUF1618 domain-containing protein n=1 Tax=Eragrostis curvula TaxID=38414 RepID=A0A5J9WL00_9POAL|nr:hypothetical protein EJB05_07629 [Eragrostis curvula]
MNSPCALLEDDVRVVASTGDKTPGGLGVSYFSSFKSPNTEELNPWSLKVKGLAQWVEEGKVRLVVDAPLGPLDMYTASLHLPATPRELFLQLQGVRVESVVENLIVISTCPRLREFRGSGEYMVYNAGTKTILLAPRINWGLFGELFLTRRVVMRLHGSYFKLIMLLRGRRTGKPYVLVWWSSTSDFSMESPRHSARGKGQWEINEVCFPKDIAQYPFAIDEAFCFKDNWACWVDLDQGIIMCDLSMNGLYCHFVPLPQKYRVTNPQMSRGRPEEYSTVAVVNGEIKLLFMDGYDDEKVPRDQVTVSTYTLSMSHGQYVWMSQEEPPFRVADLWTDESFLAIAGLPKCLPMFPVLSPKEQDMAYFFTSDICSGPRNIETKGEFVLGLNMKTKKIELSSKCRPDRSYMLFPSYIAIEFRAHPPSSNMTDQGNKKLQKRWVDLLK